MLTTVKVVALNNNNCNKKVGHKSTMLSWLGSLSYCIQIPSFQLLWVENSNILTHDVEARKRVSHVIE